MANVDAPRGAKPAFHLAGGVIRARGYTIASAYGTGIFTGDLVKAVTAGGIEAAAATNRVIGVFAGVQYVDPQGEQKFSRYWPAAQVATEIMGTVYDDPQIVFEMQADGAVTVDDRFNLADHVTTHAGNTATGQSGMEVNSSTGTGAALLRILDKVEAPNNDWGANVDLLVQIHEHEYSTGVAATPGV